MKKLLIATTALVATAGMAAADVKLTGYAEIGMTDAGGTNGMEMHTDMDIGFKLSGASDNGLTFGASIDLDEVSGGIASTGGSQAINVSGAFGTLTMGDTDGAMDKRNNEVGSLTAISDNHTGHAGYNGGSGLDSGDILRYDTSVGSFNVSASIGQDDTAGNNDVMGYGLSTTVGTVALSVGYQT
ncbi:MAG: porin, partial [Amylibacter sp.]|nr:porin [Amylibacter sp.]